jgi:hypothetical protein
MSAGAHAAVSPQKKRGLVSKVLGLIGTISIAVTVALVATGGTYALWNTKATVNASSVTSGSTAITINALPSFPIPQLDATSLLPGRSVVSAPLDVKNTGTTPVSITLGAVMFTSPANALSSSLTVYVRQSATCEATAFGTTPQSFTTPIVLAAGASTTVCVETRLSASAPTTVQGQTAAFSVQLDAVQKR